MDKYFDLVWVYHPPEAFQMDSQNLFFEQLGFGTSFFFLISKNLIGKCFGIFWWYQPPRTLKWTPKNIFF